MFDILGVAVILQLKKHGFRHHLFEMDRMKTLKGREKKNDKIIHVLLG